MDRRICMHRPNGVWAASLVAAIGIGFLAGGPALRAADEKKDHPHDAAMKQHLQMAGGPEGAAKMKEMMLKMAAHQYLLGELAKDPQVKQLAQGAEMRKALDAVKATLKDHAALDAKKDEVAEDQREAMMAIAHALMMQDKDLAHALKDAEEGKH